MFCQVVIGICVAQVNLIAVCAALAPGNVLFRISGAMLLGVLMWYSLILGSYLFKWLDSLNVATYPINLEMDETVFMGIILATGIVVAQIPLWLANQIFHWKLVCSKTPGSMDRHQFGLRHLLLGVFVLSLVLGAARVIFPLEREWEIDVEYDFWIGLIAVILCNLLITIPCIWGSFAPTTRMLRLAIVWTVYCAVLSFVEFRVLFWFLGPPGGDTVDVAVSFFLLNLSQCGTVFGSCLLLRAAGFYFFRLPVTRIPSLAHSDLG